jgi:hypothetical protein
MTRMQVQLTETQLRGLRQLSIASGRSLADLVRQGVDVYLSTQPRASRAERIERALRVAGKYSSGMTDVSAKHDRHLAEAYRK